MTLLRTRQGREELVGGAGSTLGGGRRVGGARTESPAAAGPGETLGRRFCVGLTERPGEPQAKPGGWEMQASREGRERV